MEEKRVQSFLGWNCIHVSPVMLAAAGFYFTKRGDTVRCFVCNVELSSWEKNDDPMTEHKRFNGNCKFVLHKPCGNVKIGEDASKIPMTLCFDVCGPYNNNLTVKQNQIDELLVLDADKLAVIQCDNFKMRKCSINRDKRCAQFDDSLVSNFINNSF